jgi:hypothetical protein
MDFKFEERVNESVETVIKTVRDGMSGIAPYLAGIKSIETVERREKGPGEAYLLNIWQGSMEAAPPFARPFLSEGLLRWKDHADWDEAEKLVKWRLEPFQFGSLFDCSGVNTFRPHPEGGTVLTIQGTLNIYPDKIPGVPGFLSKRLRPDIEKFIVNLITPNLRGLADGLNKYFKQKT